MEQLLHYVWKHKMFPLMSLRATSGQPVEVINPGLPNPNASPDFFSAKLRIDNMLWVGNAELHTQASDWFCHRHDRNTAYDDVILHVVNVSDCEVHRTSGDIIVQLQLCCSESIRCRYAELRQAETYPPCHPVLSSLSKPTVHSWLSVLQVERFERKAQDIAVRLERCNNHWEDVSFITLTRNFGFGLNDDAFEAWTDHLPLRAVDKHRDSLFQVEAFLFRQAGLLEEDSIQDSYYQKLRREFYYLQYKLDLPASVAAEQWRFLRLRPDNFPRMRLVRLADLYHKKQLLFSRIMVTETSEDVKQVLTVQLPPYWEEHFSSARTSPRRKKRMGENTLNLLLVNTVIPFLYAYGMYKADERLCNRATRFLETLKAESNHIIRMWSEAELPVSTAADSQALLQLQKEYCDRKNCLRCRFGYEYLKGKRTGEIKKTGRQLLGEGE